MVPTPTPEDLAALDRVVARTGHTRFRELVESRPEYWHAVHRLDGRRAYRRGKPVMRLGERQKPRANCKGCGTA
jgi:hypothetical protein